MEKYFTPVHKPSQDDAKHGKQRHHGPHHHHHCDHGSHEKTHHSAPGSHQRASADNHAHHREHHYDHSLHGYHQMDNHRADEPHTLSRSSSSSSLSTSSSSSSTWSSEPSMDNEAYLMHKPQHSLSCSNIAERPHKSHDWEDSEDTEFGLRSPTPFQHSPQHHQHRVQHSQNQHSHQHPHGSGHGPRSSKLRHGHSRSEERLLQGNDSDDGHGRWDRHSLENGTLYKTTSLERSLAASDDAEMILGAGVRPKKAVSTNQLPSKGILKNKDGGSAASNRANFRKAKSMEVLSNREQATKRAGGVMLGTSKLTDAEARRQDFVKTKLQFSAFLDEITRQVISPSRLNSLGITPGSSPTAPRSPQQERKESSGSVKKEVEGIIHQSKQRSAKTVSQSPAKVTADSHSHSRRDSHQGKHHPSPGSPTGSAGSHQHGKHKKRHSLGEGQATTRDKQHQQRYGQMFTDCTSISLETIPGEPKHRRSKRHSDGHGSGHSQSSRAHGDHKGSPPPTGHASGPGSESPTSKSSSASLSSGHGDRHKQPGHRRQSKSHRVGTSFIICRLLEKYNKELHENLLQTVACIENMETELQYSRSELGGLKEKYKRLQESYGNSQHSNSTLEQKLQSAMEGMNSERKYLLQRILDLTKQLDTAQNTICSLENINVPALIKELLQKHFKTEESVKTFLLSTAAENSKDNQSALTTVESDWLQSGQGGSEHGPVRVTAFMPWKQNQNEWPGSGEDRNAGGTKQDPEAADISQLPFTISEIGLALLKNTSDARAKGHDHRYPTAVHSELQSMSLSAQKPIEVPPNPYEGGVASRGMGHGGAGDEFTSMTAQRILDNFMSQMSPSSSASQEVRGSDPSN
ncbi:hypothetical protein ACEWY4_026903 [Coilia grayii]|uniref:Uncharacterized protein n=1 Tax=Coilia grayii TaxID=363190 RepID=A0ABD1IQX5_9TELE